EAAADGNRDEPRQLEHPSRRATGVHARVRRRHGRDDRRYAVLAGGSARAAGRLHREADGRRDAVHADGDGEERSAIAGFRRGRATAPGAPPAGGGRGANTPPQPPNFVGVNATFLRHLETLDSGDMAPNEPMTNAYAAACGDLKTAIENWRKINDTDLAALN